jgi:hypothetical protein
LKRSVAFCCSGLKHDGGWSDALLVQEFSHQLERRQPDGVIALRKSR